MPNVLQATVGSTPARSVGGVDPLVAPTQEVVRHARSWIRAVAHTPEQRTLLETPLAELGGEPTVGGHRVNSIHLPRLIYAGVRGDEEPARALAGDLREMAAARRHQGAWLGLS
jgi:hypothetical protein